MSDIKNLQIAKYEKIGSLNLLKFALAFLTFLFHWNLLFSVVYKSNLVNNFISAGAIAMSGFFMLSGFLLYYIYSKKDFSDFNYLKIFYMKRLAKILPSCYFVVAIIWILHAVLKHTFPEVLAVLMQIIPVSAFFPDMFTYGLNGMLWFVSVLLFLYFLFPFLCFIVKSVKHIFLFSAIIYLLGIFPSIVDCYHNHISLYFLPHFRICEFIMGMITARFLLNSNKPLKNDILYLLLTTFSIFMGVSVLYKNNFLNHVHFYRNYMYYDLILLILFPLLIYFLSKIKNKYFLLIAQSKISDYLGNIVYSFFLTQGICIFIIRNFFMPNNYYSMNSTQMLIFSFIMNMIFATILYELFEKRVSKILIEKLINNKNKVLNFIYGSYH